MTRPHPPAPAWLYVPMGAMTLAVGCLFGWLVQQRIDLLMHATRVPGTLVALESNRAVSTTATSKRTTVRLDVVTEVDDPQAAPGRRPRFTTLAPLLYPFADEGDRVTVLDSGGRGGHRRFVLAHPASLALQPLLALLPLGFLFMICDKVLVPARRQRPWRLLLGMAVLAPLVVGALRLS
ncbi:MAG: hypothetical protein ABW067_11925 [Rhizobacter sp.]